MLNQDLACSLRPPHACACLIAKDVSTSANTAIDFLRNLESDSHRASFLLSEADIQGFSKSDSMTKMLAITQIFYLVATCIARNRSGLPISLLELVTMGYIAHSAMMYCLWWHKPYDAEHVTRVYATVPATPGSGGARNRFPEPDPLDSGGGEQQHALANETSRSKGMLATGGIRHLYRELYTRRDEDRVTNTATAISSIIMGLANYIALVAWSWVFASPVEQWIWRASSITANLALFLSLSSWMLKDASLGNSSRIAAPIFSVLLWVLPLVYISARLALIGVSIRSLFWMPANMYDVVPWTAYLPSFS
ncbi:hypothetical protein MCOR27_007929 [Pyricularia oryzae]|nr:hypothetical protein MCOR01_001424 [Pyricularia oryzae]KAI6273333.1 hypothetical protein MCOR27_007929 [Pyricularia oryzae]KAI6308606.1 hypothetical protein MCOR29_009249 [Pyricularia oryzae]KAI6320028.1 hypothetical protein MCOR30_008395 [Pyricularia oryzae]KAI6465016.1 hypothetical protein MCOR15_003587 [Pyricularia oryzae]